jgi:peptide/nickel transport system substrate-binding protein
MTEGYWTRAMALRTRRRRFIGGIGVLSVSAGTALSCSTRGKRSSGASGAVSSGATSGQTPTPGGTFTAYVQYNPPLDPQKVSAGAQTIVGGVMSRVFRFKTGTDPQVITNHEVESDLGLSAESPDAVTWTIKLRPDAKFSNVSPVDGHAVEAEDIKATYTRALDPATGDPNRGALNMIDASQIQTPAKDTVVFKLTYPYAPFRQTLASPAYSWVYPREVLSAGYDPAKTVVGSGPFTLDSAQPDVAYTYKKNPSYFDASHVYVEGFRFAVVPDASQQLAQFSAGTIDELNNISISNLDAVKRSNPKATVLKVADGRPFPIYFQLGEPDSPFQDIRVRQAISQAIDRETLGNVIYSGQSQFTLFIPSSMGKWAAQLGDLDATTQQFYRYDPANVKKLLDASGHANLQLKFIYVTNSPFTTPEYVKEVETVNSMLNAAGIKSTLVQHDYNKDFVDAGKGSRQGYYDRDAMIYASTAGLTDPDELLFSYFNSDSTSNQEHLKDPSLDAMLAKERTLVNTDDRLKAVLGIEKYIAQKVYCVPTVGSWRFVGVLPRVQNYQYSNSLGVATETYSKVWLGS